MHTYTRLYIHAVFSVKNREKLIDKNWEHSLHKLIGFVLRQCDCKPILINGTLDHIHCFFIINPTTNISVIMKRIKGATSRWINKNNLSTHYFRWQRGFSAFTHSSNEYSVIYNYIKNQKKHHQNCSVEEELKSLKNIHLK